MSLIRGQQEGALQEEFGLQLPTGRLHTIVRESACWGAEMRTEVEDRVLS